MTASGRAIDPDPTYTARWTTGHFRSKYWVVMLCDGRCFHCDGSLVSFDAGKVTADATLPDDYLVLHVDHAQPRAKGGPDHPLNYLAACEGCNTSRQDTDLSAAQWNRAHRLWASVDVADMEQRAQAADDFYGDITLGGIRCRVHDWHLQGSPAHLECHRANLAFIEPAPVYPDLEEWSAVFGHESEATFRRLAASPLWDDPLQRHALRLTLPRVVSGRLDLLDDLLARCTYEHEVQATAGERLDIYPYARLPLAGSVATKRAMSRLEGQRRAVNGTFRDELGLSGWSELIKLFSERHWPTYIVADHVRYLSTLRSPQKKVLMNQIRSMESHRQVDDLLADLQHRYLAQIRVRRED